MPRTRQQYLDAIIRHGGHTKKIAAELGVSTRQVKHMKSELSAAGHSLPESPYMTNRVAYLEAQDSPEVSFTTLPGDDVPIDELLAHRKNQFEHKREHEEARKLIPVTINCGGPIAIWHCGDPHLDDDGTDLTQLHEHMDIVKVTAGMYAANVGDTTNNWVGRLAKLYGSQSTSAKQAWQLAEWFIHYLRGIWIYTLGGNHDCWSGDGDPLIWITRQADALYQSSEARLEIRLPAGTFRVNARHDFSGGSIYNAAHGPTKASLFGVRDHIAICGHKHKSGYGVIKDPESGISCHAIQVASYKIYDRYARDKGFRDQTLSPCAVTVINTGLEDTHPDFVKVFWQPEEGADYLRHLRRKAKLEVSREKPRELRTVRRSKDAQRGANP